MRIDAGKAAGSSHGVKVDGLGTLWYLKIVHGEVRCQV